MSGLMITTRQTKGFSLIEAMVAMVILSVGLLAVAKFQSALVSSSAQNKARAEAIAIAQNQLDEIRSYGTEEELLQNLEPSESHDASDNFTADLVQDASGETGATVEGTNADFAVSWTVNVQGTAANVAVTVSWDDPKTGSDSVTLHSMVTWISAVGRAAIAVSGQSDLAPSSTGRARLGEGEYTDDDTGLIDEDIKDQSTDNEDGTYSYRNGEEVDLIDLEGNVVLTLEEACNTNDNLLSSCTDFVKIKGRVFTDDQSSTQLANLDLNDLFVLASDAAYCAEDKNDDPEKTDDSGNYRYFNYTCYMGGAWHGNIGILQTQNGSTYDICVGDPFDAINPPEFATRRVYRGMIHKVNSSGDPIDANGDVITSGDKLDYIYNDIGAQDALVLANINDAGEDMDTYADLEGNGTEHATDSNGTVDDDTDDSYVPGHNYMLTNTDCLTALDEDGSRGLALTIAESSTHSLADADDNLIVHPFADTPDDFFCFNRAFDYDELDASGNVTATVNQKFYDDTDFRLTTNGGSFDIDASTCPYDPSGEVNTLSLITGSIFVPAEDFDLTGFVLNTSDDSTAGVEGNCSIAYESTFSATDMNAANTTAIGVLGHYTCKVYYYIDPDDSSGTWAGNVLITTPSSSYCESPSYDSYDINAATGDHDDTLDTPDFTCYSLYDDTSDLQTVISVASGSDSTPLNGDPVNLQIVVTNDGPDDATTVTLAGIDTAFNKMTLGTPTASSGSYSGGTWTIGNLASGASVTLTLPMTITGAGGERATATLSGPATGDQADISTEADVLTVELPIVITGESDVVTVIELTSGNSFPARGDTLTYLVTVTNNGPNGVANLFLDYIVGRAPTEFESISASVTLNTSCCGSYWEVGTLADGATATLTLSMTIASGAADGVYDWTMYPFDHLATPSAGNYTDNISTDDVRTASFTLSPATNADLQTTLALTSGDTTPVVGDQVTYVLTIKNNGPASATGIPDLELDGIEDLTLSVLGALTIDSITGSAGTSTPPGQKDFAFTTLNPGDEHTITIVATVQSAAAGNTVRLTAPALTASETDPVNNDSLSVDITVATTSTSTFTLSGSISNYNSTAGGTVNSMTIYAVDISDNVSTGDGSCVIIGGTSYECTITVTIGDTDGVALQMTSSTSNDDFCSYQARISAGSIAFNTNSNALWLNGVIGGSDSATEDIQYAGNNDCP